MHLKLETHTRLELLSSLALFAGLPSSFVIVIAPCCDIVVGLG